MGKAQQSQSMAVHDLSSIMSILEADVAAYPDCKDESGGGAYLYAPTSPQISAGSDSSDCSILGSAEEDKLLNEPDSWTNHVCSESSTGEAGVFEAGVLSELALNRVELHHMVG